MSQPPNLNFAFGNFNKICSTVPLTLCPLVGDADGIEPICYSRNVKLADTLIFEPCEFYCFALYAQYPIPNTQCTEIGGGRQ